MGCRKAWFKQLAVRCDNRDDLPNLFYRPWCRVAADPEQGSCSRFQAGCQRVARVQQFGARDMGKTGFRQFCLAGIVKHLRDLQNIAQLRPRPVLHPPCRRDSGQKRIGMLQDQIHQTLEDGYVFPYQFLSRSRGRSVDAGARTGVTHFYRLECQPFAAGITTSNQNACGYEDNNRFPSYPFRFTVLSSSIGEHVQARPARKPVRSSVL